MEYSQSCYLCFMLEKIPKVSIRESQINRANFFENAGWTRINFLFYMNGSSIHYVVFTGTIKLILMATVGIKIIKYNI